jgi:hypothetical protein
MGGMLIVAGCWLLVVSVRNERVAASNQQAATSNDI